MLGGWIGVQDRTNRLRDRLGLRVQAGFLALPGAEILHLACPPSQLIIAGDQCDAKATLVGVLQLLAEPLGFRVQLDTQPGSPQLGSQLQVRRQLVLWRNT